MARSTRPGADLPRDRGAHDACVFSASDEAAARRAALTADPRPPAWLELAYVHPDDGSPMAGAPYRVRFADGSEAEGTLGADGRARLDGLSPALAGTAVAVAFGDPAPAYRVLADPDAAAPNLDYRGPAGLAAVVAPTLQLASAAGGPGALTGVSIPRSPFAEIPEALDDAVDVL